MSRTGKVCKAFSTQDLSGKVLVRKQLYRNALWGNHYPRGYLPTYAPIREWRFLSSWGNKPERPSSSRNHAEPDEEDDWYSRWEKQKLKQYDDFMKKVEQDPYTALFGKSWHNLCPEPRTDRSSPGSSEGTSVPKNERTRENRPLKPMSSSTKVPKDRDTVKRQSESETMPFQEYEIDPITNRKVFKTYASPVSALGHTQPQVKDGERAFEPFSKRWNIVSPTPLDHRSIMVEHEQVLLSSTPPSKGTPPSKSQDKKEWLVQEGFGRHQVARADPQPNPQGHDAKPNTTAAKIEIALDRHLNSKSTTEKDKNDRSKLQYKPEENKTEDLDLLRPSDVRASAGLRGNLPKETDVDKQARRKKLEEKYEGCSLDRAETASNKLMQKQEQSSVQRNTIPELQFGSWSKGYLQDAELKLKEASRNTSAVRANEYSDARNSDAELINQRPNPAPISKDKVVSQSSNAVAPEAQAKFRDKVNKLKAQIVPFKAKLDAMKADYDSLRQEWLQEIRLSKERAAKKEETKSREIAQRARKIHEEEMKTHKVVMEAMEMRSSDRNTNTVKTTSAGGPGKDDAEWRTPRRLQSFFQGEGDMASNVHEFAGRDRWYKRKAPHAMDAKDAENDAKLQRAAGDRALIREIRGIYEETYGTIDTKHRQSHDLSTPPTGSSAQPITTSSGRVDAHAQLPSSAVGIAEPSKTLDKSQRSDAIVKIQKLSDQPRDAQSIIQNHQSQTKQSLDRDTQSARVRGDRDFVEATAAASSTEPKVIHTPATTVPKPTNLGVQKEPNLSSYCILAYDSATQTVKSVETFLPFSKEESLLPLDALNRLSNPAKFLAQVTSLGAKGYEPVSAATNVLVFKKKLTPQDLEMTNDHSFGGRREYKEDINHHQAQSRGTKGENADEAQEPAVKKIERGQQKAEKSSQTVTDGILEEKQPLEEAPEHPFASSASPSRTSNDRVHRQETVFSGSRQGIWVDLTGKYKRRKRAAERRRLTMKRILVTGALTAAWCYSLGVVSELMHV